MRAGVRPPEDGYVDGDRVVVAREPQQQVALDRPAEALVEAADVLDRGAAQQGGREVDRSPAEQLGPVATDRAGAGQDRGRAGVVGVGEQRAQHVGQPLPAQGQEGDVLGGAVLERDVERAGVRCSATRGRG